MWGASKKLQTKVVTASISNDFSNGHRGMAKAKRGAKKFLRSRERLEGKELTRSGTAEVTADEELSTPEASGVSGEPRCFDRPDKTEAARSFRERHLQMVREGQMTAEQYLREICAVPDNKLETMKAHLVAALAAEPR